MIIFGTYQIFAELISNGSLIHDKVVPFDLSGMKEGLDIVQVLPVTANTLYTNDPNNKVSDMMLYNYIFGNDNIFFELFSKVIYPAYCGLDIYLVVSEKCDYITETVVKIIQQRYGYNSIVLNEASDFDYMDKDLQFNLVGIYNFDIDKNRYIGISVSKGLYIPDTDKDSLNDPLLFY